MSRRPSPFPSALVNDPTPAGVARASYRNDLVTVRHDTPVLNRVTDAYDFPCGQRVATSNAMQEEDARQGKRHVQAFTTRVTCEACRARRGGAA